jgi:hypothetical protein
MTHPGSEEAERRRELVQAFLVGYDQAVRDFGTYARSRKKTRRSCWRRLLAAVRDRAYGG